MIVYVRMYVRMCPYPYIPEQCVHVVSLREKVMDMDMDGWLFSSLPARIITFTASQVKHVMLTEGGGEQSTERWLSGDNYACAALRA